MIHLTRLACMSVGDGASMNGMSYNNEQLKLPLSISLMCSPLILAALLLRLHLCANNPVSYAG